MQMKYKRKFRPFRSRYIFKLSLRDEEYRDKMAEVDISNSLKPFENEIFTSWIARNAVYNFLQPPTFINFFFVDYKNKLFNRDIDILLDRKKAEIFKKRMLQNKGTIFNTSLQSYAGYLSETITPNNRNGLISNVKIKGSYPLLKGLKFCPKCLQEEDYFRKEWRLSFYTVCLKHKCFLIDCCENCGEPINLSKRKLDIDTFNCWNCGHIYKNSKVEYINKNSLAVDYLQNTMDILNKGYFKIGNKYYYSIAYFKVLKKIANLIYTNGYRNSSIFDFERKKHKIHIRDSKELKKAILEETITLKEAFVVFTTAFEVLSSINNLKKFIENNEISYSYLKRDMNYIPFWYERFIEKFKIINYKVTDEEILSVYNYLVKNGDKPTIQKLSFFINSYLDKRKRPILKKLFD